MKRVEIEVNKSLSRHFDVTFDTGKISLNAYSIGEEGALEKIAEVELPTNDVDAAYKAIEHYRWAFGQMLKAIKENKEELQKELGVPVAQGAEAEVSQAA